MREIRFRAIHKLTKHWFDDIHIIYQDGEWFEDYRALEDGRPMNLDQVSIMQYTGLKDKNDKEIYEGDILGWDGGREGISKLPSDYIIEVLKSNHLDIELEVHTNAYMFRYDTSGYNFPSFLEEAEIVGNIYENSELLEDEVK